MVAVSTEREKSGAETSELAGRSTWGVGGGRGWIDDHDDNDDDDNDGGGWLKSCACSANC